ncbi:MAG: DNA replication and repair protein RecF [Gemmatimonadaceae bacterium]
MPVLDQLSVRNFRNFEQLDLHFPPNGVVLVGDNGQGKTNLLEAIYYFQLLRSMRGTRDADLVRFGAAAFHLHAVIVGSSPHDVTAAFGRGRKKVVADASPVKRLSGALGSLPSIIISPRDVALVTAAPSERRRFLDVALALTSRRYLSALQAYRAALTRRNAALRGVARGVESVDSVAVWEPALAASGAILLGERVAWMDRYEGEYTRLTGAIGEPEPMTMRYVTSITDPRNAAAELAETLARKRALDIRRGMTHSGPHRDDILLQIGGHDLRTFGSGGQQRTAAIALRLLEAETIKAHTGSDPLLLLDDPFAELDMHRSAHILALLRGAVTGQTILTVPCSGDIPAGLSRLTRWSVSAGMIVGAGADAGLPSEHVRTAEGAADVT